MEIQLDYDVASWEKKTACLKLPDYKVRQTSVCKEKEKEKENQQFYDISTSPFGASTLINASNSLSKSAAVMSCFFGRASPPRFSFPLTDRLFRMNLIFVQFNLS